MEPIYTKQWIEEHPITGLTYAVRLSIEWNTEGEFGVISFAHRNLRDDNAWHWETEKTIPFERKEVI